MRVAVAGGTGVVGTHVVHALRRAGHEPVVLARSRGVDVVTGRGLDAALSKVDAVIDVTNIETLSRRRATAFFTAGSERLLEAERRANVAHHVLLSIVGVDRVDTGYYQAKVEQEQLVRSSGRPFTVLRATQFHEFPGQMLARIRGPVVPMPQMRIQPVAAAEVAQRLTTIATADPLGTHTELAGPQVHDIIELARRVNNQHRHPRRILRLPVLGGTARAAARGGLLPGPGAALGAMTFDEWLTTQRR
jgi:uncharacterized protein YbjT (DUF2867 family)